MNVRWRTSERTFALADSVRCQPKGTYGILEPVLAGTRSTAFDAYEDDLQYVVDLGSWRLARRSRSPIPFTGR